ncbi:MULTISPECIES: DUF317 domain-containing protein [unclassified Streptomyces]|uniref:DUF317 domain-containing protein n=1 Tax=unclassified Streptomyces TaxID=2593676 RepID=UPI00362BBD1F
MLTHSFENLDPAQSVQVLPRHLAGPGAVDPRTVWAFPFEEGWPFTQTEAGTAAAFSPCLRLQTTFDPQPDAPGKGTWTINAHRAPFGSPDWRITFHATTPAEVVHDVHRDLLDLYFEDLHSDRDRLFENGMAEHQVYAPLLARGWRHDVKTDGSQSFLTPEGLGGLRHQYANSARTGVTWRAWGGFIDEPLWTARFSSGTPATLVGAFAASLISTEPLRRTVQDVPVRTRCGLYLATPTDKQPNGTTPVAPPPPAPGSGRTR